MQSFLPPSPLYTFQSTTRLFFSLSPKSMYLDHSEQP